MPALISSVGRIVARHERRRGQARVAALARRRTRKRSRISSEVIGRASLDSPAAGPRAVPARLSHAGESARTPTRSRAAWLAPQAGATSSRSFALPSAPSLPSARRSHRRAGDGDRPLGAVEPDRASRRGELVRHRLQVSRPGGAGGHTSRRPLDAGERSPNAPARRPRRLASSRYAGRRAARTTRRARRASPSSRRLQRRVERGDRRCRLREPSTRRAPVAARGDRHRVAPRPLTSRSIARGASRPARGEPSRSCRTADSDRPRRTTPPARGRDRRIAPIVRSPVARPGIGAGAPTGSSRAATSCASTAAVWLPRSSARRLSYDAPDGVGRRAPRRSRSCRGTASRSRGPAAARP